MPPKVAVGAAKPSGATAKPAGGAAAKQAGAGSATAKRPAATKAAGAGLGALAKGTVRLPLRLAANHMRPCQSAGSATRSVTEREISHSKRTTRVKRVRAAPMRNMCESHRVADAIRAREPSSNAHWRMQAAKGGAAKGGASKGGLAAKVGSAAKGGAAKGKAAPAAPVDPAVLAEQKRKEEEAAAARAAAEAAAEEARKAEAAKRNGKIEVRYNHYKEQMDITDGKIAIKTLDDQFCLSFVFANCRIHMTDEAPDRGVVGAPNIQEKGESIEEGEFLGLEVGKTYWVQVEEDDAEAKKSEERQAAYVARKNKEKVRGLAVSLLFSTLARGGSHANQASYPKPCSQIPQKNKLLGAAHTPSRPRMRPTPKVCM